MLIISLHPPPGLESGHGQPLFSYTTVPQRSLPRRARCKYHQAATLCITMGCLSGAATNMLLSTAYLVQYASSWVLMSLTKLES